MAEGEASQDHCEVRLRVVHLKTLMIDGSSVTSKCIAIASLLVNHVDKYKGKKELKMVYNVPTIQTVIVGAGKVLLDFSVINVIVVTMAQIQGVDVKVREFSTNNYM